MEKDNQTDVEVVDEQVDMLKRAMDACAPDKDALIQEVSNGMRLIWLEALECLDIALPDFKEPGCNDCRLHSSLKRRILNRGNDKIRELTVIMKNYLVTQVVQREVVETIHMPTHGIHKLPVGVVMPTKR